MKRKKAVVAVLVAIVAVGGAVLCFFPKERVVGGLRGGPIAPGETAYREDYVCVGIGYDFCPNWPDYGCDRLCFGVVTARTCSIETYDVATGVVSRPVECRGPARPGWGLPPR
jgi:hypothetical protein